MDIAFKDYSHQYSTVSADFTQYRYGIVVKMDDGTTEEIGTLVTLSPELTNKSRVNFRVFIHGSQTKLFDELFHECTIGEAKKQVEKEIGRLFEYFQQVRVQDRKVIVEVHFKNGYVEYAQDDDWHYIFSQSPSLMSYSAFNIERMLKRVDSHYHGMECNFVRVISPCSDLPDEKYLSENYM